MTLHPQSQQFLKDLAAKRGPGWHEIPVEEGRKLFNSLDVIFGQGPDLHAVEERVIQGRIPVRVYRPTDAAAPQPVIVYFHGGGWVLGNIQTHDTVCRRLAETSGFVVISVDYRLAPEHKYPAAMDDAYSTTQYISERAQELGVDADRLIVAGDSAGGNLAAAVAFRARDVGGPRIAKQVLIYPVVEPDFSTDSYLAFADDYGLTKASMEWFWQQYIGDTTADRKYACLANAESRDLPPAFLLTAEYDVLRDEGERFAERLRSAGVEVELKRYPGMVHGFVHFASVFDDSAQAIQDIANAVTMLESPRK